LRIFYGLRRFASTAGRYLLPAVIIVVVVITWRHNQYRLPPASSILTPQLPETVLSRNPLWNRPATAPNGSPWPTSSNYIAGYPRLSVFGLESVVADNTGGSEDLFVKLIDRDELPMKAVRIFLLKSKEQLTLRRVKPGHYDLRYMNLDTGRIRKSDAFEVTLKKTAKGEEYMGWTVGLYDVLNGNTYHEEITERDF
jgi:hypothetical protein